MNEQEHPSYPVRFPSPLFLPTYDEDETDLTGMYDYSQAPRLWDTVNRA